MRYEREIVTVCSGLVELVAWKLLYCMSHCLFTWLRTNVDLERVAMLSEIFKGIFPFWNDRPCDISILQDAILPGTLLLSREAFFCCNSWPWRQHSPFSSEVLILIKTPSSFSMQSKLTFYKLQSNPWYNRDDTFLRNKDNILGY